MQETWVQSLGGEDPLEEGMATHSAILTWRIPHGQRSLVGYSLWGCKESDTTEWLSTAQQHVISKPKALCELPIVKKEQANTINYILELTFQEEEEKRF